MPGDVSEVPVTGRNEYGKLAFQVGGSLKFKTVKYGHESRWTLIREDCAGEAQPQL
jgi:hypothetical protein